MLEVNVTKFITNFKQVVGAIMHSFAYPLIR